MKICHCRARKAVGWGESLDSVIPSETAWTSFSAQFPLLNSQYVKLATNH